MIDLVAGSFVCAAGLVVAAAWASSAALRGTRVERIERGGSSALLGAGVQRVAYRGLERVGAALARAGLSANAVTLASIPFAAVAAVALAYERYGVASLLAAASFACDALDGIVARATGSASNAGEILDAVCDRVCEVLMMSGVALAWRGSEPLLAIALLAQVGAQQVSLASAKVEGFAVARERVPRGLMRRAERAVYFVGAAALGGVLQELVPGAQAASVARAPLVVAMTLIAVVGNASALSRLAALARELRTGEVQRARQ